MSRPSQAGTSLARAESSPMLSERGSKGSVSMDQTLGNDTPHGDGPTSRGSTSRGESTPRAGSTPRHSASARSLAGPDGTFFGMYGSRSPRAQALPLKRESIDSSLDTESKFSPT